MQNFLLRIFLMACVAFLLAGCGKKGVLYLPKTPPKSVPSTAPPTQPTQPTQPDPAPK